MSDVTISTSYPVAAESAAPRDLDVVTEYRLATESRLAFYRSLGRRYWKTFAGMMLLVAAYSALTAARISAVGILDVLRVRFTTQTGDFIEGIDKISQRIFGPTAISMAERLHNDESFFYWFLGGALFIFAIAAVLMAITYFFKELLAQSLIVRMEVDIRKALFQHLTRQSVAYFNRQRSGDVISRLTNDVNAVRSSFKLFFEDLVQQPFLIFFSLIVAFLASPMLFVCIVPFYGILMLPVLRSGRKIIKHGRGRLEKLSLVTESIQQLFSGIRIVKAFGMERREEEEFAEKNYEFVRSTLKMSKAKIKARSFQELFYNLGTAIAIAAGAALIAMNFLDPVRFLAFMFAMVQIYMPLKAISNAWNQLQESRSGVDRLLEILREKPLIKDHDGSLDLPKVIDEIRFENVSFSYAALHPASQESAGEAGEEPPRHLPVLHDISFAAKAGEVVALVGPSGAGKSTLADLLARFYDPQKGRILVDGRDIRDYRYSSFLKAVAIVSQDPFLFHTTIRENIRYGRESATNEEIEDAAKVAYAHEFILEQPQAYDTVIGERGVKLSGGQRQRVTIARAVLKNAQILILDEATSSLDSQSEKEVQRAIDNLIKQRTTFIIAHRLSTISHADKILVIDDGRIVETGRHEKLLEIRGRYFQLWRSQNPEV